MVIVVQWIQPSLGTRHCIRHLAAEKTHLSEGKWSKSGLISSSLQTRLNADYKVYMWKKALEACFTHCCPESSDAFLGYGFGQCNCSAPDFTRNLPAKHHVLS